MEPSDLSLPPTQASEVARLDDALERCTGTVSLEQLRASGRTAFRTFSRKAVVREVLEVAEAFVLDRVRQVERELSGIVERRESEAKEEGRLRVLQSIVDFGDMIDVMRVTLTEEGSQVATRTLDQRLDRMFRSFGFQRIPTTGEMFDAEVHEMVDEEERDDTPPDTILREVGRGYRSEEFVLRVARVVVATRGSGSS